MRERKTETVAPRRWRGVSISWKLGAYLVFFVAFVLLVTWVFQVLLLNIFYQTVKRGELDRAANDIAMHIDAPVEELKSMAYRYAVDSSMSANVYRIEGVRARQLVSESSPGEAFISFLSPKKLSEFYTLASENEGYYQAVLPFANFVPELVDNEETLSASESPSHRFLVTVQLVTGADGEEYMVLLNTGLAPLNATVNTLRILFCWIAAILLLAAAVMVILLSRWISNPLVRMSKSARQLALGQYDVAFPVEGYRETRELAQTLNYASEELSKLDRLQKELIANISHDLRTPLTMIRGYSEVIRDIPEENTAENLQVIIDETTRLSELVNDLLDLSRIQAGMRKPIPECFDLDATVGEVLTRYEAFVKRQGYVIRFSSVGETWVMADRSMVLQAIYNLINNAINYTGEDHTVTVSLTRQNDSIRFSVQDTGAGIAAEDIPAIWSRYYRVDRVHRRAVIGTGLGLSIVKEVLDAHGALYGVQSTVGGGSTFWFDLPTVETSQTSLTTSQEDKP